MLGRLAPSGGHAGRLLSAHRRLGDASHSVSTYLSDKRAVCLAIAKIEIVRKFFASGINPGPKSKFEENCRS